MVVANQLFDALTAANVPRDQAHAVVDAIEHRMTAELATKADLAREVGLLRTETRAEFAAVRAEMAAEFAAVRAEMAAEFAAVRAEMKVEFAAVRAEMQAEFAAVRAEMKAEFAAVRAETKDLINDLQIKLLVYLGGLQVASITILFFALEYVGR